MTTLTRAIVTAAVVASCAAPARAQTRYDTRPPRTPSGAVHVSEDSAAPLLADLVAARALYPATMTRESTAALLNRVAYDHRAEGWGLLRKGSGNSCPIAGTFVSCDILVHAPSVMHYDVLMDAVTTNKPQWNSAGPCVLSDSSGCEMGHFLAPVPYDGAVVISPPPSPPPDLTGRVVSTNPELEAEVRTLHADVDRLAATVQRLSEQLERSYVDLVAHFNLLPSQITVPPFTAPTYRGTLFGVPVTLKPQ